MNTKIVQTPFGGPEVLELVDQEAVGRQVTALRPGDRVFGMARFPREGAAYARYAIVPAIDLVPTPDSPHRRHRRGTPTRRNDRLAGLRRTGLKVSRIGMGCMSTH